MGKYSGFESEFQNGFAKGNWKSIAQFAISKGIDPNNGAFKKGTKGWKKKAQEYARSLEGEAKGIAKERIIKKKADVWESVYNSLSNVGEKIAETLEKFTDSDAEDSPFIYEDEHGNKHLDYKAIKSVADSAIQIHTLIKKTTTEEKIPLSAENVHKVEEAKQIKAEEKGGNDDNLIEDRIKAKMKAHGLD